MDFKDDELSTWLKRGFSSLVVCLFVCLFAFFLKGGGIISAGF